MNEERIRSDSQNLSTQLSSRTIARRGFLGRLAAATGATVAGFTAGMLVGTRGESTGRIKSLRVGYSNATNYPEQ